MEPSAAETLRQGLLQCVKPRAAPLIMQATAMGLGTEILPRLIDITDMAVLYSASNESYRSSDALVVVKHSTQANDPKFFTLVEHYIRLRERNVVRWGIVFSVAIKRQPATRAEIDIARRLEDLETVSRSDLDVFCNVAADDLDDLYYIAMESEECQQVREEMATLYPEMSLLMHASFYVGPYHRYIPLLLEDLFRDIAAFEHECSTTPVPLPTTVIVAFSARIEMAFFAIQPFRRSNSFLARLLGCMIRFFALRDSRFVFFTDGVTYKRCQRSAILAWRRRDPYFYSAYYAHLRHHFQLGRAE